MGAVDLTQRMSGKCDQAEVKRRLGKMIEAAQHQHGAGGYTGTWAEKSQHDVRFVPQVLNTEDDAEDYGRTFVEKWGPTLIMKVQPRGKDPYWFLYARASS